MSNLIDRQQAIDGINKLMEIHFDRQVVLKKARDVVEQLPPANTSEIPNSSDTISRAKAIDGKICIQRSNGVEIYDDYAVPVEYLKQLPPAQPERIKGRWIYHPEIGWGETWLCDQCGEKTSSTVMGKPRANFCPNCGADMKEVTDGNHN